MNGPYSDKDKMIGKAFAGYKVNDDFVLTGKMYANGELWMRF